MKFKSLLCYALAVILALPVVAPASSYAAGRFTDTSGHWAEKYINTAVNEKIVSGYPDGSFLPDKAVTRAEFATMVNKALGNTGSENISFSDVPYGEWFYGDISKAVAAAYTAGYDDKTFRPNSPITRQEAAVMISRIVPAFGKEGNLRSYPDYRSIADWAYDALEKVNGKGYMGAYGDGNIHPLDSLTRAQTAKIICDIIDNETIVKTNAVIDDDGTKYVGKIYANNVTIDEDLGEDSATIENCVILGTLSVKGGGTETITVNNSRVSNVSVNKDDDSVRVLAKGETAIVRLSASQTCILQTSGLSGGLFGPGFSSINANSSSDVTLKGSFPKVNVTGSRAKVGLESGTITNLTVESGGRYSDITVASGTTVSNATVNAECYFHGSGTISHMAVNADDVTYETKPKSWTIASSADTPKAVDSALTITFSPKNGATNVYLDTDITLTFNEEIEMEDGDSIQNSDIDDFIELRKNSSTGTKVSFSASINSSKKIITLNPSSDLDDDTKYYVIMDKDSVRNDDGDKNSAQSISFTTGDDTGSITTTFSPSDGATAVSVNTSITISFSEAVVRYSNGATISSSDDYLEDCLIFKKTNSSGTNVSYNATINSTKKTITITPSSPLALNQKYYVAVLSSKLKTDDDGIAIPEKSVTWTTGVTTPVVDSLSLNAGEATITASLTPNIAGTAYLVALSSSETAPSAAQIVAGQNSSGVLVDATYRSNSAVSAGTAKSFSFSGFASNTSYTVYAVLNANSLNSAVKSATVSTIKPVTKLTSLSVVPTVAGDPNPGNQISFSGSTTTYNLTLNSGISELTINASGSGSITIDGDTTATDSAMKIISLTGNKSITVRIDKTGTDGTTYTINVTQSNSADISSLSVSANGTTLSDSGVRTYNLADNGDTIIIISVTAADKFATVNMGGPDTIRTGSTTFTLPSSDTNQTYSFSITSGSDTSNYTVTFVRPVPSEGGI